MGLNINVYVAKNFADCSSNGVSNQNDVLCVSNIDGPFDPSGNNEVLLVRGPGHNQAILVPKEEYEKGEHTMFGGNYGGSSDSRFAEAVEKLVGSRLGVVAIHDRIER